MDHPHRDTRTPPTVPHGSHERRAKSGQVAPASSGTAGDDHRPAQHSTDRKQQVLTKHRASVTHSIIGAVAIKHGDPAMFSRSDGMLPMGEDNLGYGLYARDCRFLNGYEIQLAGNVMEPLGVSEASGDRALFALSNREIRLQDGTVIQKDELGVTWERVIRYGDDRGQDLPVLQERLSLMNYGPHHVDAPLAFSFSSAFEDIFEIRGLTGKARGTIQQPAWDGDTLHLAYNGTDDVARRLRIHFSPPPTSVEGTSARFQLSIAPRASSTISISLTPSEAFVTNKSGSASSGERTDPDAAGDRARAATRRLRASSSHRPPPASARNQRVAHPQAPHRRAHRRFALRSRKGRQRFGRGGVRRKPA